MSSDPSQTTSQIQDELLTEVKLELERRGTSKVQRRPQAEKDTLAAFAVSAILACLALLGGTGAIMALAYTPTVEDANASTAWFSGGALGGVARGAHYHASSLLVLLSAAYVGYLVWCGLFRRPAQWRWWRAMMLLGLAVLFSLSGQLLPFDQLAAHGTGIRLGYLAEAPVIGNALREAIQGGEGIGNSTLTRFFGMHIVVLPAFCVILLRWLWRDSESRSPVIYNLAIAGAVLVLVVGAALLFPAPLGMQGNLSEPYPEARPEWFGLPLYALMRVAPPGPAHLLILFAGPLLVLAVMSALPFIETVATRPARLRKPLQIGLIAAVAFVLIFSAVPVIQDMSADEGWFRKQTPEDIMTAMGTRNKALLNSAELPPADAHNHARDMQVLHERLIGNYTDPIDDAGRKKWDELAKRGVEAARALLLAPDSATQIKAREELRQVCKDCHKEHEKEDVPIDPPPMFAAAATREPARAEFFFNQEALVTLQPAAFERTNSTEKMMDQLKYSLRDILVEAEVIEDRRSPDKPKRSREQALVDLKAVTEIVATHYEKNAGTYFEESKWNAWVADLRKATAELAVARDATEVGKRTVAVGKACESCHDGADDPTEPIEWRFQSLLTPD
jgi:quinol-cytochrome oxidoreductase complex cytochrome b subunit